VSVAGGGLSFALMGAHGAGSVSGSVESFPDALPGAGLELGSEKGGVAWQTSMTPAAAAAGLNWTVGTSDGLAAKLVSDQVEFVNRAGKVVWVFQTPVVVTKAGKPVATVVSLARAVSGYVIHVAAPQPTPAAGQDASFDPRTSAAAAVFVAAGDDEVLWQGQVVATSYFSAVNCPDFDGVRVCRSSNSMRLVEWF
jgi:antitoxin (DNA-binding transcriptional repressor) of toxin-antitoxin stability system